MFVGKLSMEAGTYQVVIKNADATKSDFTKSILVTEIGTLGATNHILGFTIFAYGTSERYT